MKKLLLLLIIVSLLLVACEEPVPREGPSPPKYVPPPVPEPENVTLTELVLMNNQNTFIVDIFVDKSSFNPSEKEINEVLDISKFKFKQLTGVELKLRKIHYLSSLNEEGSNSNNYKQMLQYKTILDDKAVNGIIVLTKEFNTEIAGGFSTAYEFLDYCNGFKSKYGQNRIYYAYMDWDHKYGICGYENGEHVSDVSIGGECRNQPGTSCVFNGDYYICENFQENYYAQSKNLVACTIVHEFMHPFGELGNYDHYGTQGCNEYLGIDEYNTSDFQYYCGMCPNVYGNFKDSFVEC